jgi:hypothetical protein
MDLRKRHLQKLNLYFAGMQTPFQLTFISDLWEYKAEVGNRGFRLFYSLTC